MYALSHLIEHHTILIIHTQLCDYKMIRLKKSVNDKIKKCLWIQIWAEISLLNKLNKNKNKILNSMIINLTCYVQKRGMETAIKKPFIYSSTISQLYSI